MPIQPTLKWYTAISVRRGVTPRCPHAKGRLCPRYYETFSLLADAGVAGGFREAEDELLYQKWKESELLPSAAEEETSVAGKDGEAAILSNFCPEVSFEVFGLFATYLSRYSDELDRDNAHAWLAERRVAGDDWRWRWQFVHELHYTDCPIYSTLEGNGGPNTNGSQQEQIIGVNPSFYGISVNVRALIRRLWRAVRLTKRSK